ncbi:MAG: methionyl-tRNA formyltransferase [Acidobacteria bacterium]|nr:methionyl-tRNA formyltransferase [Acidobacteriota bacterium]MCL5289307.1 methionyl-tRNA formyltransferase [Acidobacteriota bacterium]
MFCGTPEFALPTLQRLIAEPVFSVETVITQPDRPRGRGREVSSSPVKDAALDAGIHVFQPERIKSDSAFDFFKRVAPDAVVIIAYGQIVPARLLDIPRLGWINLHASLLPKYRGAAPINWAIVNGETRTGLTTMRIDPGMDTGPTLLHWETEILPDETSLELARRMAAAGPDLMVETLRRYERREIAPVPQDHTQATLAPMLKREDGRIEWSQPAAQIYNRIRGLDPWPGAFTSFRGQVCHIWGRVEAQQEITAPGTLTASGGNIFVACGAGTSLRLEHVQLEGKKRISARDWAHGARLKTGDSFGD